MSLGREEDIERVKRAAMELGEHFDSVQIFCTRHMPAETEGTRTMQYGTGNWYTRFGHVKEWVIMAEEDMRSNSRKTHEEDM